MAFAFNINSVVELVSNADIPPEMQAAELSMKHVLMAVTSLLLAGVASLTASHWTETVATRSVQPEPTPSSRPSGGPPPTDAARGQTFVDSLPLAGELQTRSVDAVEQIRRACTRHGLELVRASLDPQSNTQAGSGGQLCQLGVRVSVRGRYPSVKAMFDEVIQRTRPAILANLSVARLEDAAPHTTIQADAVLLLPARAAPWSGGGSLPTPGPCGAKT